MENPPVHVDPVVVALQEKDQEIQALILKVGQYVDEISQRNVIINSMRKDLSKIQTVLVTYANENDWTYFNDSVDEINRGLSYLKLNKTQTPGYAQVELTVRVLLDDVSNPDKADYHVRDLLHSLLVNDTEDYDIDMIEIKEQD